MEWVVIHFVFMGSWSTRRRSIMRTGARRKARGSTFWNLFRSALAFKPRELSLPHVSTTSPGSPGEDSASLVELDGSVCGVLDGMAIAVNSASPNGDLQLRSDVLSEFMRCWVHTVSSSICDFGLYVRGFSCGNIHFLSARCRNLLAMPRIEWTDLEP